ncbi:MAG TPA: DUF1592 domain-containing protein [Polyangiaceae bacterium]|nr:DUF1592 domain-containing protein [Polyangiaceae bacterium]
MKSLNTLQSYLVRLPPRLTTLSCLALALGGCSASGAASPAGAAGHGSGGSGSNGAGGSGGSIATTSSDALPARIRRLSNAEYDASVRALLGSTSSPSQEFSFPPDAKQGPANSPAGPAFTVNDAQRVDPVLADKLDIAAQALVAEARQSGKLAALSPCSDESAAGGEACAKSFIQSVGTRAYRRRLLDAEVAGLLKAYHVGADGYSHADGVAQVARVLLQSPGFLYTTEIGEPGAGAGFVMTSDEIATALAYLLTSGPPDDALLQVAASGTLATPEARESEAKRLLATPAGHERFVRVVREWLGIDDVARREKSQSVYPEFAALSQSMEKESRAFIEEVLFNANGTLADLFGADWTIADAPLAAVYGATSAGDGQRISLAGSGRRGILSQAAFLSVFATNNGSHPVFRGVALMRRVACLPVPDPGALGIVVSSPAPDPSKTTRARFEAHALDSGCAGCHGTIDNFGFAFENFDGIGRWRTAENGLPIDASVSLTTGSDLDGTYASSAELIDALARSTSVKQCLARQLFRSTAARSDASVQEAEEGFVELWRQLPEEQQGRLADVLVALVKSKAFIQRRTP